MDWSIESPEASATGVAVPLTNRFNVVAAVGAV